MYSFAQIIVTTIDVNKTQVLAYSTQPWSQVILQILIFSYDFWDLDFFHSVIPPFCVSDKITDLHLLALQYLPALYPLLLIALTYILIELHDKNVRVVVCLYGGHFVDVLLLSREGGIQRHLLSVVLQPS